MLKMIWYEWKKIWGSRLTQLAVTGCVVFLIFCTYSSITQISARDKNGELFYGMGAAQAMRETQEETALTQERVDELVGRYLAYTKDPATGSDNKDYEYLSEEIYKTFYLPNRELLNLIESTYAFGSDKSMKEIFEENEGRDFGEARLNRDRSYIKTREELGELTSKEAGYWEERIENIPVLRYGYHKGWSMILDTTSWFILIMTVICVGIAPVFAGEYQSKCDSLVLCMKYGKSKLALAKITAAWLYTTCVYWGITLAYSLAYLGLLGTDGRELPIQLKYPTSPILYDLTMGEAVLLFLILEYVLTLGLMGFTLFMSAVLKSSYGVIILSFLSIIVPTFLSTEAGDYAWRHILSLLPAKAADFGFYSCITYHIGGTVLSWPAMAILVNGAAAAVCLLLSYGIFRGHQVNK